LSCFNDDFCLALDLIPNPFSRGEGAKSLSSGEGFRVRSKAENKKVQLDKVGLI
jgi:hypothetical protein